MAIYFCHFRFIRRSQAHNIIAAAAYRSAEKLIDYSNQQKHFFKNKKDVIFKKILLPEEAPVDFLNREVLWNQVNFIEKRKNARFAQEIIFALPVELNQSTQEKLVLEFAAYYFVKPGMCADICIHKSIDGCNPHVHILLTTRSVTSHGFGLKEIQWQRRAFLFYIRQEWANFQNSYLANHGINIRIDNRKLIHQGILIKPMHIKSIRPSKAPLNQIKQINTQKLLINPLQALHYLTCKQVSFSQKTLTQFLNTQTINPVDHQQLKNKIIQSQAFLTLGLDSNNQSRFTSAQMINTEQVLLKNAHYLSQQSHTFHLPSTHPFFLKLTPTQQQAVLYILQSRKLICLNSGATFHELKTVNQAICELYKTNQQTLYILTLTSKMKHDLMYSDMNTINLTLMEYLNQWNRHQIETQNAIIILHEAQSIDLVHMEQLITSCRLLAAKLIIFSHAGTRNLQDVDAAFGVLVETIGCFQFQSNNTKYTVENHFVHSIDKLLRQSNSTLYAHENSQDTLNNILQAYHYALKRHGFDQVALIGARRLDVMLINHEYRKNLIHQGQLKESHYLKIKPSIHPDSDSKGFPDSLYKPFSLGERLIFNQADASLNIQRGDRGTLVALVDNQMKVQCDRGHFILMNVNQYNTFDYGYASTVHPIQKNKIPYTLLFFTKSFDIASAKLALTRHSQQASIHYSRHTFPTIFSLEEHLKNTHDTDFKIEQQIFALRRGYFIPEPYHIGEFSAEEQRLLYTWVHHETIERYDQLSQQYQQNQAKKITQLQNKRQALLKKQPKKLNPLQQWIRNKKSDSKATQTWELAMKEWDQQYQTVFQTIKKQTSYTYNQQITQEIKWLLSDYPSHPASKQNTFQPKPFNLKGYPNIQEKTALHHLISDYDTSSHWTLIAANTLLAYSRSQDLEPNNPLEVPLKRCFYHLTQATKLLHVNRALDIFLMHITGWIENKKRFIQLNNQSPKLAALVSDYYCLQSVFSDNAFKTNQSITINILKNDFKKSFNLQQSIKLNATINPHHTSKKIGLMFIQSFHNILSNSRKKTFDLRKQ